MFQAKYPEEANKLSYETYRVIFKTEFNISFGYTRSDTCSTCDEFIAKTGDIDAKLNSEECHDNRDDLLQQKRQLEVNNDLHKGWVGYCILARERLELMLKNMCHLKRFAWISKKIPNKTTNDITRDINLYHICVLSTKDSYFTVITRLLQRREPMMLHPCCTIL